ncbi:MAG: hypothetical protein V3V14_01405 [Saprospiraceae bacterium]
MPKDGSWFFDSSNKSNEELMDKCDSGFSDYPDGSMNDLYRIYAEEHKAKIFKINK